MYAETACVCGKSAVYENAVKGSCQVIFTDDY